MSLRDCITKTVKSDKERSRLLAIADDEALAAEVVDSISQIRGRMQLTVQDARKVKDLSKHVSETTIGGLTAVEKVKAPVLSTEDLVEGMEWSGSGNGRISIASRSMALIQSFHTKVDEFMRSAKLPGIHNKILGRTSEAWEKQAAIALHGGDVEDPAMTALGKAFEGIAEEVRAKLNATGMNIAKLKKNYVPHKHSPSRLVAAGREQWKTDMHSYFKIELAKNSKYKTVDELLDRVYHNITQGTELQARSVREMQRKLEVKGGLEWYEYNKKYGDLDVFGTINSYIQSSSNLIAAREVLGSQPRRNLEKILEAAKKAEEGLRNRGEKFAPSTMNSRALYMYDTLMGIGGVRDTLAGRIGQTTRAGQVVSRLGLSTLTAVTDTAFSESAALFKQMPLVKTIVTQFKEVVDRGNKEFMSQIGAISDIVIDDIHQAHRFAEASGNSKATMAAHAYLRMIGLNRWTQGMKTGHMYQLLAHLTNFSTGGMPEGMVRALKKYGIGAEEIQALGKAKRVSHKGASFIDVKELPDDLKTRVIAMLHAETKLAVPEGTVKSAATLRLGQAPGTVTGELVQTLTQFKSFPLSVIQMQTGAYRGLNTKQLRSGYFINLLAGSTIMGAVSLIAKDLVQGKEPKDIDAHFMVEALAHGGAFGPIMDLIYQTGEYGSAADFFTGPTMPLFTFLVKNTKDLATGNFDAGAASSTVLRNLGKTAGPVKLLLNRWLLDGLREHINPREYERIMREQRRMQERGQEYYWRPHEVTPF